MSKRDFKRLLNFTKSNKNCEEKVNNSYKNYQSDLVSFTKEKGFDFIISNTNSRKEALDGNVLKCIYAGKKALKNLSIFALASATMINSTLGVSNYLERQNKNKVFFQKLGNGEKLFKNMLKKIKASQKLNNKERKSAIAYFYKANNATTHLSVKDIENLISFYNVNFRSDKKIDQNASKMHIAFIENKFGSQCVSRVNSLIEEITKVYENFDPCFTLELDISSKRKKKSFKCKSKSDFKKNKDKIIKTSAERSNLSESLFEIVDKKEDEASENSYNGTSLIQPIFDVSSDNGLEGLSPSIPPILEAINAEQQEHTSLFEYKRGVSLKEVKVLFKRRNKLMEEINFALDCLLFSDNLEFKLNEIVLKLENMNKTISKITDENDFERAKNKINVLSNSFEEILKIKKVEIPNLVLGFLNYTQSYLDSRINEIKSNNAPLLANAKNILEKISFCNNSQAETIKDLVLKIENFKYKFKNNKIGAKVDKIKLKCTQEASNAMDELNKLIDSLTNECNMARFILSEKEMLFKYKNELVEKIEACIDSKNNHFLSHDLEIELHSVILKLKNMSKDIDKIEDETSLQKIKDKINRFSKSFEKIEISVCLAQKLNLLNNSQSILDSEINSVKNSNAPLLANAKNILEKIDSCDNSQTEIIKDLILKIENFEYKLEDNKTNIKIDEIKSQYNQEALIAINKLNELVENLTNELSRIDVSTLNQREEFDLNQKEDFKGLSSVFFPTDNQNEILDEAPAQQKIDDYFPSNFSVDFVDYSVPLSKIVFEEKTKSEQDENEKIIKTEPDTLFSTQVDERDTFNVSKKEIDVFNRVDI